ncbi:hypothetical protein [Helicobacter pylori]|nr:hypothetical protein [Helicobacter pylori]
MALLKDTFLQDLFTNQFYFKENIHEKTLITLSLSRFIAFKR